MNDVIRNILSRLDAQSVQHAELVSTVWRQAISEECIWRFVLRNKVMNGNLICVVMLMTGCVVDTCYSVVGEICSFRRN